MEFVQGFGIFDDSCMVVWVDQEGIIIFKIVFYLLWMNGKVERVVRIMFNCIRVIMLVYKVLEKLFLFVMQFVVYVGNLLFLRVNEGDISVYEKYIIRFNMFEGEWKLYIWYLCLYFCDVYYYVKLVYWVNLDKFIVRVEKGKFIGYVDIYGKIYWVWNLVIDKVVKVNVVKFNEGDFYRFDDDEYKDIEYEVVFIDSIIVEEEDVVINRMVFLGRKVIFDDKFIIILEFDLQQSVLIVEIGKVKDFGQIILFILKVMLLLILFLLFEVLDVEDFFDVEEVEDIWFEVFILLNYD